MIEVKSLTKTYGKFKAVDDVNLVAMPGKITILLGPNGAGKSTILLLTLKNALPIFLKLLFYMNY